MLPTYLKPSCYKIFKRFWCVFEDFQTFKFAFVIIRIVSVFLHATFHITTVQFPKLLRSAVLIFVLGVNPIYAQSSEISILKTKRENIQKLVRAYQDSLADLGFIISELESGNSVDYSETFFYKKTRIKNTTVVSKASTSKSGSKRADTITSRDQVKSNFSRNESKISKKKSTSSFSKISKPTIQTKKYRTRVGAICRDGTRSYATGRGACSHHGGVSRWLVE